MVKILVTGASGLLATELRKHIPFIGVSHKDFDILNYHDVKKTFDYYKPDLVVHLAAETDVARGDIQKELFYKVEEVYKIIGLVKKFYRCV